ncbi:hypothetical protein RHMOL_Rhmol08G0232600 [Rhododendron molle]|uniref:Uncharacterized protein n=1 Tax=Rhododendron molle TaxID=49168 RepID=A0ACC0MRH1_RHOML|nr:hypothetical protein RHMOL_Rhmol08G0232600 [Rhododendron molle]
MLYPSHLHKKESQHSEGKFSRTMGRRVSTCIFSVSLFLAFLMASSQDAGVQRALVQFMAELSPGNLARDPDFGWNNASDPCKDNWRGVTCRGPLPVVTKIVLDGLNLTGVLDAASLCNVTSIWVLSLKSNNLSGGIQSEISNCRALTHLYLAGNRFSGGLPSSVPQLGNLKRLDISNNDLSGLLPDLSRISGLLTFLAQNNQLTGGIPNFDFPNLDQFNVSNNNFSGPIPGDVDGHFGLDSFSGNQLLCGEPLPNPCPLPPPPPPPPPLLPVDRKSKRPSKSDNLIYSGYGVLGLALVIILFAYMLFKRKKAPEEENTGGTTINKTIGNSSEFKTKAVGRYTSEYSMTSRGSEKNYSSLVVFSTPSVGELKFDDLLKAQAELVGRGKYGSLFKVMLDGGVTMAVKRIKNVGIPCEDFKRQMRRIDGVKHPNVLPVIAYYCSQNEKLLVYEFQHNGSLFKHLHESQNGQLFDWASRLGVAASVAQALAFMHEELRDDGIAHGNLKSSNILLNKDMEPSISEYGLMVVENDEDLSVEFSADSIRSNNTPTTTRGYSAFKVDVYAFGVILLELLTGKIVQNGGFDLGKWVHSVVCEEWTVEVFDKALLSEGASEERMVNLLQVALQCINPSPEARPSIGQIATFINSITEAEERSLGSEL